MSEVFAPWEESHPPSCGAWVESSYRVLQSICSPTTCLIEKETKGQRRAVLQPRPHGEPLAERLLFVPGPEGFPLQVPLEFLPWMHNFSSSLSSTQWGAASDNQVVEVLPVSPSSLPIKAMEQS